MGMVSSIPSTEYFLSLPLEEAAAHGMLRLLFIAAMLRPKAISMLRINKKSEIFRSFRAKSPWVSLLLLREMLASHGEIWDKEN